MDSAKLDLALALAAQRRQLCLEAAAMRSDARKAAQAGKAGK